MALPFPIRWFCLGAGLLLTGCAETALFHFDDRGSGYQTVHANLKPPTPAPPLMIPGSPRLASANAENQAPVLTFAASQQREETLPPPLETEKTSPDTRVHSGDPLRELSRNAAKAYAGVDSYVLRLRRREMVGNQKMPEEMMLLKYRRQPMSIYLKWLGNEGKGREVVYVQGKYDNNIQVRMAAGDVPLLPGGMRMAFSPDNRMVREKSRYPISEAGLGPLVARFGKLIDAVEKGDKSQGSVKHLGEILRPEFDGKVEAVLQTIPLKSDPLFPRGGERLWCFDRTLHLPILIVSKDNTGREVEYYCHDRIQFPVRLDDDDFNPDVLWKARP